MELLVMMEHAHLFVQSCGRTNGDLQMNGQWGTVVSCWSLKVDSKSLIDLIKKERNEVHINSNLIHQIRALINKEQSC
jgi:hypothetical protein